MSGGDFRYTARQVSFAVLAMAILCGVSLLNLRQIRILAAITFAGALIGSFLVLFVGADLLGAKRELDFGPIHLQPSEFLKPSFAILAAAVLADRQPLPIPKPLVTFLMLAPALAILLLQPDVGQTGLLLCLWGAMLFFWGLSFTWVGIMAGVTASLGSWPMKSFRMCIAAWTSIWAIPRPAIRRDWPSRLSRMAAWRASVPARAR